MSYPGQRPPFRSRTARLPVDENPRVANVIEEFSRLQSHPDYLAAHDGRVFPKDRYTRKNYSGNRSRVHFQGIQRHRTRNVVVLSGGDAIDKVSQLFVLNLESRPARGPFGSNVVGSGRPVEEDRLAGIAFLDRDFWHAGGVSMVGDILAVPLEGKNSSGEAASNVVFLDFTDPAAPHLFNRETFIERPPDIGKAGTAALCRLPTNGRYVCGVWSDSDHRETRFDFYMSRTTNFSDGFEPQPVTWPASKMIPTGGRKVQYQSTNFVVQEDGTLFVVATENTSPGAPIIGGDDVADLLLVAFPDAMLRNRNPRLEPPVISRVAERRFARGDGRYNLDGAGGAFIGAGGRIFLYGGYHWRRSREIRLAEFRPETPANSPPIRRLEDAWIDLFEHKDFGGRRLSILGDREHRISDYDEIRVQGRKFARSVSSVRFQMPPGSTYRLYPRRGFESERRQPRHLDLVGTGGVVEVHNFARDLKFNDKVRSSSYL